MEIRALTGADKDAFRALRREALADSPHAFSESVADHDGTPSEVWTARFTALDDNNFIVGAFDNFGTLVGSVGLARNTQEKTRHKAIIWGVYLKPDARGSGMAKAMLLETIRRAKGLPGLEQIKLGVRTGDNPARRLYSSVGFESFGVERHSLKIGGEYPEYVDEAWMVLSLTGPTPHPDIL